MSETVTERVRKSNRFMRRKTICNRRIDISYYNTTIFNKTYHTISQHNIK